VRRHREVVVVGERRDLQERCDAADPGRVGLQDLETARPSIDAACSRVLVSIPPASSS